ncbi:MAG: damage-inducible protein CinA [Rhodospirillaceae bacterium TMED8]|nr:damage-inducible protein CinA [Magnetovibrio sp.]OUT51611.1 MAG: damage-inducible protein CinA [Rhodospirillaceae bacterium TMED8]|tara:strand:- start:189 stop:683 length:495 start_codon:yes stop_codon:yes gene_type:complete
MIFDIGILAGATDLLAICREKKIKLATAESCTGGLISGVLTAVPGASAIVERGFITYSNEAKAEMLGVQNALLTSVGAVSEEVACAMADGALERSRANLSAAVTGIAGPDGGSKEKPVGLVYIAVARQGFKTRHNRYLFSGDRDSVRRQTLIEVLGMLTLLVKG